MTITGIARRKYLADALYEALPELEKALFREGKGRYVGVFLQRSLIENADDGTLERVLFDVKCEIGTLGDSAAAVSAPNLAVETRAREAANSLSRHS